LTVLSDVVSPLCGKNGATAVYGPQKGVRKDDVAAIDAAIERFAALCEKPELMDVPGAGAAGGLGFALMVVGGEMVSGAEFVMDAMELSSKLSGADWVMTGEGRSDAQTLQGKLPLKVAQAARSAGAKVALVSGSVDQGALSHLEQEFDLVISAKPDGMDVEQAMGQAESLLAKAVRTICGNSSLRS
jgi:glycerate kinase